MKSEAPFDVTQFPLEIITEILSRLPVKFLLRLKSVSKFWFSLISSPHFIKMHLNLSANKEDSQRMLILDYYPYEDDKWFYKECHVTSLFVDSVTQALDLDYYPFEDDNHAFYDRGSCNGLVLLASESIDYLILWNPTIRKYKNLSDFRPKWEQQLCTFGFGYDELHDDYKVVVIVYHESDFRIDDSEVKVYSLKSDSWTSVDYSGESVFSKTSAGDYEETLHFLAEFVDGKLYWSTFPSDPNVPRGRNLISFDVANEKWDKLEKPSFEVGESEWGVGKLGSDLCVFSHYKETHLGVWVMNKYGTKQLWIKKFSIRHPTGQRLDPPYFMSNKGEMLFLVRCVFMIYNSKDDSFRYTEVTNRQGNHDVLIYIESLVSPFSTEGTENAENEKAERSKQLGNN